MVRDRVMDRDRARTEIGQNEQEQGAHTACVGMNIIMCSVNAA